MKKRMLLVLCLVLLGQPRLCAAPAVCQEVPTPKELQAAQALSEQFQRRWEEQADIGPLLDEMFAPDFIERYLAQQQRELAEAETPPASFSFATGFECKSALLVQVSPANWRRFFAAAQNFYFLLFVGGLNQIAPRLLQDDDLSDEEADHVIQQLLTAQVRDSFKQQPTLKDFGKEVHHPPIGTPEELLEVTVLLEQAAVLLKQEHGQQFFKLTPAARQVIEKFMTAEVGDPSVEILATERLGCPAGMRVLSVATSMLQLLEVTQLDGQYKVLWVTGISI